METQNNWKEKGYKFSKIYFLSLLGALLCFSIVSLGSFALGFNLREPSAVQVFVGVVVWAFVILFLPAFIFWMIQRISVPHKKVEVEPQVGFSKFLLKAEKLIGFLTIVGLIVTILSGQGVLGLVLFWPLFGLYLLVGTIGIIARARARASKK